MANHSSQDAVNSESASFGQSGGNRKDKKKKKEKKKKKKKGRSRSTSNFGNSGDVHDYVEDDIDEEDDESVSPAAVKEELEEEKATVSKLVV